MEAVIKKFGFAELKAEIEKKREEVVESACKNPSNAALVLAFHELSQLYYKEGNRNAGLTYSKVGNAIRDLDVEVTEKNAMSLGKGSKTKVSGIGPSSAEKILEFVKTGTMEKLEEKRSS
jgi:DNA polymerase/3'-5' exonuclease PolX